MSIVMRIIQQFDPCHEEAFMALEQDFARLEKSQPGLPEGKRMQVLSAGEPVNALIWQCEFPDMGTACKALDLFKENEAHEALFAQQAPFIRQVKIEFYKILDFNKEKEAFVVNAAPL
ncbi:MAG: hypothetical protein KF746_20645 [Chitinophagaceae bacterium]|nr:hypothetical protein [Chitinophagaceae bacterium]